MNAAVPSTSAGEEEVDAKPNLRDILRCGVCELIFFNLDDFVLHKNNDCKDIKEEKPSFDDNSDFEVIRHSPSKAKKHGKGHKSSSSADYEVEHRYKEQNAYKDVKIKAEPLDDDEHKFCGICENCLRTENCEECKVCLKKRSGSWKYMSKRCLLRQCIEEINGQVYQLEKVLDKRIVDGQVEYFLRKDYPDSLNGWEPEENIYRKDLIYKYERGQESEEKRQLSSTKRALQDKGSFSLAKRLKPPNEDFVTGAIVKTDSSSQALGLHQELGEVEYLESEEAKKSPGTSPKVVKRTENRKKVLEILNCIPRSATQDLQNEGSVVGSSAVYLPKPGEPGRYVLVTDEQNQISSLEQSNLNPKISLGLKKLVPEIILDNGTIKGSVNVADFVPRIKVKADDDDIQVISQMQNKQQTANLYGYMQKNTSPHKKRPGRPKKPMHGVRRRRGRPRKEAQLIKLTNGSYLGSTLGELMRRKSSFVSRRVKEGQKIKKNRVFVLMKDSTIVEVTGRNRQKAVIKADKNRQKAG